MQGKSNQVESLNAAGVAATLMTPARVGIQAVAEKASPERFNTPNQPMAVLLEGSFESAQADCRPLITMLRTSLENDCGGRWRHY